MLSIGIDVTERVRSEQLRREEQARREALLRLTRRLEAARGAPEIADALHAEIAADVGYRNVWILLADANAQRYRLEGTVGDAPFAQTWTFTTRGAGCSATAQSSAESPPPRITRSLPRNCSGFFTE